ncbi:Uncharacterized protein Vi05172_g9120 [Venturia inaequalis]|nr:Uncharacterized protein Vi05172_g9120 [Venturia inaequalis]
MLQVSLASRSFRVEDYTYGSVNVAITTNVAVHLSLITAIVPRIRLLATPSAIRPSTHPTHSTHPLSPARPQNSPNPYLLDLTSTTITSERSRSEDLHNNPCLPQPLTKALSRDTLRSAGENGPTIHLDTKSTIRSTSITTNMTIDDFSLVPTNTLAQLSTTVYRPYTLTETFPSGWTAASEEVEYVRGGFMSQVVVTEPARTLEIGKKTEVKIEIDDVGSSRGNLSVTNVEQPQKRVSPRDILKLEQKRNNQRNDENQVFIRGGFGVYG